MAYIQSFRRYETKYLLTRQQAEQLVEMAGDMLIPDRYGDYTICNLYLDTEDFYFIEHSLDKPMYKEKLRLRSYGNNDGEGTAFLEIKKKYNGVVYKRRITLPYIQAQRYLLHGERPQCLDGFRQEQIFTEIDWLIKRYSPVPRVYLAYDRRAYASEQFQGLRVTFDSSIRSRFSELTLAHDSGTQLLHTGIEDYRLMEIKSDGAVPYPLAQILSELRIYPVSFSKYGNIYKAFLCADKEIHV